MPGASEVSEHTQQLIDEEVRRIVDAAHEQVVTLLQGNRDKLDSLAQALLERETLDENEAYAGSRSHARRDRAGSFESTQSQPSERPGLQRGRRYSRIGHAATVDQEALLTPFVAGRPVVLHNHSPRAAPKTPNGERPI